MKEEFLHYLWKYRLYDPASLIDNNGNKISVIHPGEYNRDAGPDFFNSRLLIGGTIWAGNVEIHICSSHFDLHGHQTDPAFNNVILHVVFENDKKVFNERGEEILTTRIEFDSIYYNRYLSLVNNPSIIACQDELYKVDKIYVQHWLNRLVIERLEGKSDLIYSTLEETANDWDETLYRLLARYFGFRVNTEPFEMLARALPFRIIRKHSDSRFQIEALLFGTSGMLEEKLFKEAITDKYYCDLIKEFKVLAVKYSLKPIQGWLWKFSRLRPANFPTVRISQLAELLSVSGGLFSRIIDAKDILVLRSLFEVTASEYWNTHFVFGKESPETTKNAGSQASDILLINAVLPVIFVFGRSRDHQDLCDRALDFLGKIKAEDNKIITEWLSAGIEIESAFFSQGLIQLRNEYCKKRACLNCRIGNKLISSGHRLKDQEELILEP